MCKSRQMIVIEVLYSNVLKKRGFNRSLDMWSTGVIIYVALSGQFPFNEDVDIEDQIKNAQFMYPNRPWKSISKEAVNCIQNLLVVEHEARYTVDDALQDLWVSDQQCKNDILRLEEEAGFLLFISGGEQQLLFFLLFLFWG